MTERRMFFAQVVDLHLHLGPKPPARRRQVNLVCSPDPSCTTRGKKKPSIIRSTSLLIRSRLSCVATFWLAGGLIWSALPRLSSHTRPSFVVWLRLGASAFLRPLAMQSGLLAVHAFKTQYSVLRIGYLQTAPRVIPYLAIIHSFSHSPICRRPHLARAGFPGQCSAPRTIE